jgi:hypothetical protein
LAERVAMNRGKKAHMGERLDHIDFKRTHYKSLAGNSIRGMKYSQPPGTRQFGQILFPPATSRTRLKFLNFKFIELRRAGNY